jgi:hypothetical protein
MTSTLRANRKPARMKSIERSTLAHQRRGYSKARGHWGTDSASQMISSVILRRGAMWKFAPFP